MREKKLEIVFPNISITSLQSSYINRYIFQLHSTLLHIMFLLSLYIFSLLPCTNTARNKYSYFITRVNCTTTLQRFIHVNIDQMIH